MSDAVGQHCSTVDRCNQRGGRMLSVVDLLEAGTLSEDVAAYALAAIRGGASFMIGANPGGAGKTTIMGALLNFVPPDVPLATAADIDSIEHGLSEDAPRHCYVCHEIGGGCYYAYLWGPALRRYFELPRAGHMLATNLHADTYDEARTQVCDENGVAPAAFRRMHLLFFLSVERGATGPSRTIHSIWESDGTEDHHQLMAPNADGLHVDASRLVPTESLAGARATISDLVASKARTIEEVRAFLVHSGAQ